MTKRIETIVSLITFSETFADVGCDHGYCAEEVLKKGLAKTVYVTDISKPSLKKAEALLSKNYQGKFIPIVTDGLKNVPEVEQVLIAGMGGEEIIKILQKAAYKPVIVILQPMKNADKVRKYLHMSGYGIERDFMFFDGDKYYEVMRAVLNVVDGYTETEELYGRENLQRNSDFLRYLRAKIEEIEGLLQLDGLNRDSRLSLTKRLENLRGIKDETERNLRTD